jgi:hypothetical protein
MLTGCEWSDRGDRVLGERRFAIQLRVARGEKERASQFTQVGHERYIARARDVLAKATYSLQGTG